MKKNGDHYYRIVRSHMYIFFPEDDDNPNRVQVTDLTAAPFSYENRVHYHQNQKAYHCANLQAFESFVPQVDYEIEVAAFSMELEPFLHFMQIANENNPKLS
ncbi:hypothetical protein [Paenibacillus sp. WLX2291]|uniref:hypothetical protein n=1 Tax=Paenibacillus sp. WLX2291 TaxID=3296934 RepID=UPI003984114C